MSGPLAVGLAFAGGAGLGVMYLLSLWHMVSCLPKSENPGLLTFASMLTRIVAVLLGFYLIGGGRWQLVLAALGGFVCARFMILRRFPHRPLASNQPPGSQRFLG